MSQVNIIVYIINSDIASVQSKKVNEVICYFFPYIENVCNEEMFYL